MRKISGLSRQCVVGSAIVVVLVAAAGVATWLNLRTLTIESVFAMQDEVPQKLVTLLAINLAVEAQAEQTHYNTDNADAHDIYLQGWVHYKRLTPEDFARAKPYFEKAIALDPNYAQAHAALASLYWDVFRNNWAFDLDMPSFRAESRAKEHLTKALKAPTPLAYVLQSRILASMGFLNEAVMEAEKAVALDPGDATALAGLANALMLAGQPDKGLAFIEDAMRLNPRHPPNYLITQGAVEFGMGRFKHAAVTFERAVKHNPHNELPLIYLAASYGHLGRIKDADDAIETANDLRAKLGMGDLSLERKSIHAYSPFKGEIDFIRFGGKPAQERVRAGLTEIPALTWHYLVTVHPVLDAGNTWWEIEGATEIDVATAKSFHDNGVMFIDASKESVWKKGHIPDAVNLPSTRNNEDPTKRRFTDAILKEIVDKTEEIVIYSYGPEGDTAFTVAKAVNWGYQKVFYLVGGVHTWKAAGHPIEKDE